MLIWAPDCRLSLGFYPFVNFGFVSLPFPTPHLWL